MLVLRSRSDKTVGCAKSTEEVHSLLSALFRGVGWARKLKTCL